MTRWIFFEWLLKFNKTYSLKGQKVALVIDSCTAHGTVAGVLSLNSSHVHVIFLPPNTTYVIQPLDASITAALKCRYRRLQVGHVTDLDDIESDNIYKVEILQRIRWITSEWTTSPSALIADCWRWTSLISIASTANDEVEKIFEEERQALILEVAEEVSEEKNGMSIAHLLCDPFEYNTAESYSGHNLLEYVISPDGEQVDDHSVSKNESFSLPSVREQLRTLEFAKLILAEMNAPMAALSVIARVQTDLRREVVRGAHQTKITSVFEFE